MNNLAGDIAKEMRLFEYSQFKKAFPYVRIFLSQDYRKHLLFVPEVKPEVVVERISKPQRKCKDDEQRRRHCVQAMKNLKPEDFVENGDDRSFCKGPDAWKLYRNGQLKELEA